MNFKLPLVIALGALFVVGQGCSAPIENVSSELPDTSVQTTSFYEEFSQGKYVVAKTDGKPILLNFYANWCPTCREQEPRTVSLFIDGRVPDGIAAFRVNYDDTDTDDDEKALAKELRVTYQHTYIYFDSSGNETARTIGTTPDGTVLKNLEKIAP